MLQEVGKVQCIFPCLTTLVAVALLASTAVFEDYGVSFHR